MFVSNSVNGAVLLDVCDEAVLRSFGLSVLTTKMLLARGIADLREYTL